MVAEPLASLSCAGSPTALEGSVHARRWFYALALVALVVPACSGGSGGGGDDCTDLATKGDTFEVTIENFALSPSSFAASAAQSARIHNADGAVHSFTPQGTEIDIEVPAGETGGGDPVTGVVQPGTYTLICTYHPDMKGEVTVVA